MKEQLLKIIKDLEKNNITDDDIKSILFNLLNNDNDLIKKERTRIWVELCKGEKEFDSTIELEADDIYDMIFKEKTIMEEKTNFYDIGESVDLPFNKEVKFILNKNDKFYKGIIVGKSTTDITQMHIVKSIDGQFPNETYPYDTLSIPLHLIVKE